MNNAKQEGITFYFDKIAYHYTGFYPMMVYTEALKYIMNIEEYNEFIKGALPNVNRT